MEAVDKPRNISFKGATDLVTDTDKAAEAAILAALQEHCPDHAVLGEEGGIYGNPASPYLWCALILAPRRTA
jgi:myo-inositol-1(or 4)-monophosphatase